MTLNLSPSKLIYPVAFVGKDIRHTLNLFDEFCRENASDIQRYSKTGGLAHMKDGTKIIRINPNCDFRGYRFSQIIVAIDSKAGIYGPDNLKHLLTRLSGIVPAEFEVQEYDTAYGV